VSDKIPVLNKIVIGDKELRLSPLKGRKARLMIPKIVNVISRIIFAAIRAGVDTGKILAFFGTEGKEIEWSTIPLDDLLKAVHFMIESITDDHLEFINDEAMPFLLQLPLENADWKKWWNEEAEPLETYQAVYKAIRYHLSTSFGKATVEAVKKSLAAEEEAAESDNSE
jgi:hypothetical protein